MKTPKLQIRLYGDPCLREKSQPVKEITAEKRAIIQVMISLMHENKGIGLAAPQVGINERFFVADVGEGPFVFINPAIVEKKDEGVMEEGCLSIPGIQININRPLEIIVKYTDMNNQPIERLCTDLLARVVLHEIDHLDGKLIVDYVSFAERLKMRKALREIIKKSKAQQEEL